MPFYLIRLAPDKLGSGVLFLKLARMGLVHQENMTTPKIVRLISSMVAAWSAAAGPGLLDPKAASELIRSNAKDKGFVILDVRTPGEFREGRLKGAVNVDYLAGALEKELPQLDNKKTYLVYCAVGGRSAKSAQFLRKAGFKKVFDMKGGITAWKGEQLPLIGGASLE